MGSRVEVSVRQLFSSALAISLLVLPLACAPYRSNGPNVGREPPPSDDVAPIEWARSEPYLIVIHRSCRTLSVYRRGEWFKTYRQIAFGRERGDKVYEGDRRTPKGLYMVIGRRYHARWSRFLLLDYPNVRDLAKHQASVAAGDATRGPGGQVGIHGTDKPRFNEVGVDWTFGCIAMRNDDVRELYDLVPDGTLVLIDD